MIYEPLKGGNDKSTDAIKICLHNFVMTALFVALIAMKGGPYL